MTSKGNPRRSVRCEEALWERFGRSAAAQGRDRAGLIRDFIRWHAGEPGAELPERPPVDEQ